MKLLKPVFILILLLCISKKSAAQFSPEEQLQIDSINQVITSGTSHDTCKVQAFNTLGEVYASSNLDTVIYFCNKALNLAQKCLSKNPSKLIAHSLRLSMATSLNNIGYVHMNKSRDSLAIDFYQKSLKIENENNNRKGMASAYNNIGLIYYNQGNIPKALDYYHKSLQIKEEFDDKKGMAMSFNNIGFIYGEQGDYDLALDYYKKSLDIQTKLDNKKGMALSYNNIGLVYFRKKELNTALNYYTKSLNLKLEIGDKKGIANSYQNIGNLYKSKDEINTAIDYYNKALQIRKEIDDQEGLAYSYTDIGTLTFQKGNITEAHSYAKMGLETGQKIGFPEAIEKSADLLSKIAAKQKNWKEAFEMYTLAKQMHDSLASESAIKAAANQQAKYTYEKAKAISDLEQAKKDAIANEEKQQQQIIIYSIAAGLALILIFFILLYKRFQITKRQNHIIKEQKNLVDEKHKEITDSINYAERIQRSFLATKEMLDEHLKDYFVFFKPKDIVSGDFYWSGNLSNGNFALITADSTGHGVPGAIMSLLNITSIEAAIKDGETEPAQILNATRKTIIERLKKDGSTEGGKDGMDAALTVYNFTNKILYIAAAHNPVWIVRDKQTIEIKADKMPVGKHDRQDNSFTQHEFQLQENDVVYTLTDGFPDQFGGEKGKKFMSKNLRELLAQNAELPMNQQKEILNTTFANWVNNLEQVDDVTIIGVRIH